VEIGTLTNGTPEQVYQRSREILTSGIMEGGRFIFREGNNLPPNVPWCNLAAMYKAVQDIGRY
jgi:uroporphyrinogen-III decarboxylase